MIWYLLYPFRGTTEPPRLASDHPIRKAFFRHGTTTARHWLMSILLSVGIAVLSCYPVFFLYDNPAAGFSKLPHHVWTSARVFEGSESTRPDVEMRQVWVHGNYKQALEPDVLLEALEMQKALIGETFGHEIRDSPGSAPVPEGSPLSEAFGASCVSDAPQNITWGFHSPLMYWNCSSSAIRDDKNIVATVNAQSHRQTFLNITLRPSLVFAGKTFARGKLQAADALVITLFDRIGFGIGEEWEDRFIALAKRASGRWSFYPENGKVARSQLYEFNFRPMSLGDDLLLALAYLCMAFYVMVTLRKLRAVKSRFGLVVTAVSQIAISILASFTICGIMKINLARIPREAYPFVVLVIGLENMFRLINAVLANPPEMPTIQRVANALGDVGHLSLAAAGQNLFILWLLSLVVSPGVAAFCAFAAVALVFDFIFHLTFFTAVLSVDVRRMELQDSLERVTYAPTTRRSSRSERKTWTDALFQGKLPFSTRIAGSAVTMSFILALNWHFFDDEDQARSFSSFLLSMRPRLRSRGSHQPVPAPPPINQARTPAAWLRMQDTDTAKEVVRLVKPHAHHFVARVYDPVIVVLKGADRNGAAIQPPSLFAVLRELVEEHFFPFALAVVFAIAVVTILMNYLLWDELPEEDADLEDSADPPISVKTLPKSHGLDVVKVTACNKGHLIVVSLDRNVTVWGLDPRTNIYTPNAINTSAFAPPLWPITAAATDETGTWLALCTDTGRIVIWNIYQRRFAHAINVELGCQTPLAFLFSFMHPGDTESLSLVIVTPDGWLREVGFLRPATMQPYPICDGRLTSASIISCATTPPKILTLEEGGGIHLTLRHSPGWITEPLSGNIRDGKVAKPKFLLAVIPLCIFAAARSHEVDLIDPHTRRLFHRFRIGKAKCRSLRILHSPRRACPSCGASAVHSISLAYTEAQTEDCVIHTYTLEDDPHSLLCLRSSVDYEKRNCHGLESANEVVHRIQQPGVWEATSMQTVLGVRRRPGTVECASYASDSEAGPLSTPDGRSRGPASVANGSLTRRSAPRTRPSNYASDEEPDEWEAWALSSTGELHTTPLVPPSVTDDYFGPPEGEALFVARAGPIVRLGKRSIAVGYGNLVKIIMLGNERFEEDVDQFQDLASVAVRWRRRGLSRKNQ